MSTRITVTSGSDALLATAQQVQAANRASQLQRERDSALQSQVTAATAEQAAQTQRPLGGTPNTSVERRPSAQRQAGFGLLFQCVFIDAPGTSWSDGTVLDPFVSYDPNTVTAQLLANATDPTTLQELDVTVPAYTAATWKSFNARSPMAGGILKRRYRPYTGKENGSVHYRYGYGGFKLKQPTVSPTPVTGTITPKFETTYSDALQLNRFPFHVFPEIHGAVVVGFGITDGSQTITVANGGPSISVGASIRIAPEWTSNSSAQSFIVNYLMPKLETNYTVTAVSVGSSTTVYTLNTIIYDGASSGIPARLYKSYGSWAAVPINEVRWTWSDSVRQADLPAGSWNDVSNTFDYYNSAGADQANAGTAWTLVEMRRVQIQGPFETITANGSGLQVPYPSDAALTAAYLDSWVVRQGEYNIGRNTDTVLAKTPYGPYVYDPDLAPDTGYQSKNGPWELWNTSADYDAQLFNVTIRQGTFPDHTDYIVQVPFASLSPLLSPGFGNAWLSGTPEDRFSNPPGTYYSLSVTLVD
jgi:hypothetical protein